MPVRTSNTSFFKTISLRSAILWLMIIHFFGAIGLLIPATRFWFELATPLSLIVSAGLLLYFHHDWNKYFLVFLIFAFLAGFGIEVAGVQTEVIFGSYQYKTTLGYKILGVPLMIGVNWLMLSYASGVITASFSLPLLLKSMLAAMLMTLMDYFIEPVAIIHQYWAWTEADIPLQNYLAWFVVSWVISTVFFLLPFEKSNALARYLLLIQVLFFLALQAGHHIVN